MNYHNDNFECSTKPSVLSTIKIDKKCNQNLEQEGRKYWEISGHCSKLLFQSSYPDIQFSNRSANYYYQIYCNESVPNEDLVRNVRNAYYRVLAQLNSSSSQVNNFILPVQLLKLKHIDPYSRQRIVENLCRYLTSQPQLRSVVLEQAGITFPDLCRLLLSLARNSLVRKLYLFGVLDSCDVPFKGPFQSEINLDYLPRVPFTYNAGGRKYLRELKIKKENSTLSTYIKFENIFRNVKTLTDSEIISLIAWMEGLIEDSLANVPENEIIVPQNEAIDDFCEQIDKRDFVFTQFDVGVQCDLSSNLSYEICHIPRRSTNFATDLNNTILNDTFTKIKIDCCKQFLKVYENTEIRNETLRKIYMVALSGLINLTVLSVNYKLLGDGTGDALMSIGSVTKGKLRELELLCLMDELPSAPSKIYDQNACHAIPDHVWAKVKRHCPDLKVKMVCMSMSTNEVTKMFITKSIPLCSIHFDNGFCPTLVTPQILFFRTLKFLTVNFKHSLEHIDVTLWHTSERIDGALEYLLKEVLHLKSFEYHGPLQYKNSINKLCNAALHPMSEIAIFKLMVQGDPCYRGVARDLVNRLYKEYLPKFCEKSIIFELGTHSV